MNALGALLHVRPGEGRRVLWVAAIGVAFAAATQIGDDVAQSVFVTEVGPRSLPGVFLAKALIDALAAALYLPMTRGRGPTAVWLVALAVYAATVIGAGAWARGGGEAGAYALYVGHECAWTILTIHWGVFILDAFDASQARRLFPLLFTAARVGGIVAGALVGALAGRLGAFALLWLCVGFAVCAGLLALVRHEHHEHPVTLEQPDQAIADDDQVARSELGVLGTWRTALQSPLVRTIAWSTAAMVVLREGLHMISLAEIAEHGGDPAGVAAFLGTFGAIANAAGIALGILVVPRLLSRAGLGVANVLYAVCTAGAVLALWVAPSLAAAAAARFTRNQLKDALKTPLSALFYGAEPPHLRAGARATIFGAAIPAATLVTAGFLAAGNRWLTVETILAISLAVAAGFVLASAEQNRRWRARLIELLRWKVGRQPPPDPARLAAARAALSEWRNADRSAVVDDVASGLAATDPRVRAVAEEVLAEVVPRAPAHRVVRDLQG